MEKLGDETVPKGQTGPTDDEEVCVQMQEIRTKVVVELHLLIFFESTRN